MQPLRVVPKLELEKQAVDQGHVQGLFASKLSLPPESFEELLRSATELWETNGCDHRFVEIGIAACARRLPWRDILGSPGQLSIARRSPLTTIPIDALDPAPAAAKRWKCHWYPEHESEHSGHSRRRR
jgi:hypothetical protein